MVKTYYTENATICVNYINFYTLVYNFVENFVEIFVEIFVEKICVISILFLFQHNCILSRAVVYKKAFDISRKGSHTRPTPITQQNHKNTNPRV